MTLQAEKTSTDCIYLPQTGVLPEGFGGKALGLARLQTLGERVPRWIALHAAELPALQEALRAAGLADAMLAVRSSAEAEDGEQHSFAGQFRTILGVPARNHQALWQAIAIVCQSGGSDAAQAYAQRAGGSTSVGVIIQEMVDASASGVAFTADPVSGERDAVVIAAVRGLGEGLVSGELDGDTYRVRSGSITRELRQQDRAVVLAPDGGTRLELIPEPLRGTPVLSDDEVHRIVDCARRVEAGLGLPQDLEWALVDRGGRDRELVLLQARPITTLGEQPRGERRVWDNSNIVESYHGVTTPLTFSFARNVYEEVYLQFCALLGVEEVLLERHRDVFANMLGLVRGRVYYNLLNWYRALSLLPGYGVNRAFMERMMGVRGKLEDPPEPPYTARKWDDAGRLLRMSLRLWREHRRLPREIQRFHARVDEILLPYAGLDLSGHSLDELAALFRRLERELLRQWRAPLVNDFFAMIAFGVLGRLVEGWVADAPPSLVNDLLSGEGGIISTEPAERVRKMADQIGSSAALTAVFSDSDDARVWRRLQSDPDCAVLKHEIQQYLDRFGERCANELKLETVTLAGDPLLLIRMLRAYAVNPPQTHEAGKLRRQAEARVRTGCSGIRRWLLMRVLAGARARVRDRENLRFERTRVFGLARRIFLAIGRQMARAGRLDTERDVFYLTREEIFAALEGTGVTADLRGLVRLRKAEFHGYIAEPAPPDRFESYGPPQNVPPRIGADAAELLQGTACCPGVMRGAVRLVREPSGAGDLNGRILVAERTDPGWTLLFPLAKGLLVQRGSLLSHSAIVAREIGLPCIVGIAGLMDTLVDGEWVEMDGASGTIHRIEAPQ